MGLRKGDIVFFSTSLGMVGTAKDVFTNDELNQLFLDCFRLVLGEEGTILVPTYSYTFGESTTTELACFDPDETVSRVGSFPEFIRKQIDARRTWR